MISIEQMLSNDHRASDPFNIEKSNASSSFELFRLSSFIESLVVLFRSWPIRVKSRFVLNIFSC